MCGDSQEFCPSLLTDTLLKQEHLILATLKWCHTGIGFATPPRYRDVRRLVTKTTEWAEDSAHVPFSMMFFVKRTTMLHMLDVY